MSDRTSVGGVLDLLIASPIQLTESAKHCRRRLLNRSSSRLRAPRGMSCCARWSRRQVFGDAARDFLSEAGCDVFDGQ